MFNPSDAKLFCTHTVCRRGVETTPLYFLNTSKPKVLHAMLVNFRKVEMDEIYFVWLP